MRERIQNQLYISCDDVDLTAISNIEFYVKQTGFFRCYTPDVISKSEMVVTIPFEDAKRLREGTARLQFAFVDGNGVPDASEVIEVAVDVLLKEAGYDPL